MVYNRRGMVGMTIQVIMNKNTIRQRRLRQRRKEAGLLDYRRAVTPEQAKALDELLEKMRLAQ